MTYKHTAAQVTDILAQTKASPWLWLLEIEIPTSSTVTSSLRLVRNPKPITWGTFNDGTAKSWEPFPFQVGVVQESNDGALRGLSVSCENVNREVQAILELYDGLLDQTATLRLISASNLSSTVPYWTASGKVVSSTADDKKAALQIGHANIEARKFPGQVITRDRCNRKYGGVLCGYDTTRSGSLPTCDFTLDGDNGCNVHGDDEDTAGVTRLHPLRFGAFLAVPKKLGIGT